LGPGGARHDDVLLAAHGAQEALELELERLRFRGLEPYVVNDLLERGRTKACSPASAGRSPPSLSQVERAVAGRLEDPKLAGALARHAARREIRDGALANSMRALAMSRVA